MNISRKDFLKGIAAGAAVSAVSGITAFADEAPEAVSVHAWEQPLVPITDIVAEETYDIVVVGAGMAGAAAAYSASAEGASVCVVEKFDTFTAHGTDIGAIGTKLQAEAGVEINKADAARLIYDWSQQQANYALIRTFVEKSGEVVDELIDRALAHGYEVHLNNQMTARTDWNNLADRFKQFSTAHKFAPLSQSIRDDGKWVTANVIGMNLEDAEANGAVIKYSTKAEQLVREGDQITGIIVSDAEGYKKLNVTKGVILATGGIANNDEMIKCFCPLFLRNDSNQYTPVGGATGDAIVMGMQIGAARSRCYPAPICHPVNLNVMGPGFDTTWLAVNRDGMRYGNEMGYEPIVTNSRMNNPGNVSWCIWDANYREHAIHQEPIKANSFIDGLEEAVEKCVESGAFLKADTLAELAEKIGVPAERLEATVARYNKWCDQGVDEDFGVPERFLSSVKDAPFYATKINAWLLALPYGLHVDANSQVCDEDDNPIGGLFAIGNAQGDFFANSYPVACPGTSHGRGVVFGTLVGKALANDTVIGGYDIFMNA